MLGTHEKGPPKVGRPSPGKTQRREENPSPPTMGHLRPRKKGSPQLIPALHGHRLTSSRSSSARSMLTRANMAAAEQLYDRSAMSGDTLKSSAWGNEAATCSEWAITQLRQSREHFGDPPAASPACPG